jgi:hypothetical protein
LKTTTLYDMCVQWAKLAPRECAVDKGDFATLFHKGESYYVSWPGRTRSDNATIFDSVCFWLENRSVVGFGVEYTKKTYLATVLAFGEGDELLKHYSHHENDTPARALLSAYLEYLRRNP